MKEQRPNAKSTVEQQAPARKTLNEQIEEFFKKGKTVQKVPGFEQVKQK